MESRDSTTDVDRSHPWSTSDDDDALALLFDAAGNVSWVNDTFSAITGWPAERCLEQSIAGLRRRLGLQIDLASLRDALGGGHPWRGELGLRTRNGEALRLLAQVDALHDSQGRVVGAVAVACEDHSEPEPRACVLPHGRPSQEREASETPSTRARGAEPK